MSIDKSSASNDENIEIFGRKVIKQLDQNSLHLNFSHEENYISFQLFREIDFNSSGFITAVQLRNYLYGDFYQFYTVSFQYGDTGINWYLLDGYITIQNYELYSPASSHPEIIKGLRLHRLNNVDIPYEEYGFDILSWLYTQLLHNIQHEKTTTAAIHFDFYVPLFIVNTCNQNLDIIIENQRYFIHIPIGAVNNLQTFENEINEILIKQVGTQTIYCKINLNTRQFQFISYSTPFQCLFSASRSCCYLLGFPSNDTNFAMSHIGEVLFHNISLNVNNIEAVNLVTTHLLHVLKFSLHITHFDEVKIYEPDSTTKITFEQFRILFINYFENTEKLNKLREYTQYFYKRFNQQVNYDYMMQMKYDKYARKQELLKTSGEILAAQNIIKHAFLVDADGMGRKHGNIILNNTNINNNNNNNVRYKKNIQQQLEGELDVENNNKLMSGRYDWIEQQTKRRMRRRQHHQEIGPVGTSSMSIYDKKNPLLSPTNHSEVILLKDVLKSAEVYLSKMRRLRGKVHHPVGIYPYEIRQVYTNIWVTLQNSGRLIKSVGDMKDVDIAIVEEARRIANTPALKFSKPYYEEDVAMGHMELTSIDQYRANPAITSYYMHTTPPMKSGPKYDVFTCHPVYFGSNYMRQPSRHISLCTSIAHRLHGDQGKSMDLIYKPMLFEEDVSILSEGISQISPSLVELSSTLYSIVEDEELNVNHLQKPISMTHSSRQLQTYSSSMLTSQTINHNIGPNSSTLSVISHSISIAYGSRDSEPNNSVTSSVLEEFRPSVVVPRPKEADDFLNRPKTSRGQPPPLPLQGTIPSSSGRSTAVEEQRNSVSPPLTAIQTNDSSAASATIATATDIPVNTLVNSGHIFKNDVYMMTAHKTAELFTEQILSIVVSSLVAMEVGSDFIYDTFSSSFSDAVAKYEDLDHNEHLSDQNIKRNELEQTSLLFDGEIRTSIDPFSSQYQFTSRYVPPSQQQQHSVDVSFGAYTRPNARTFIPRKLISPDSNKILPDQRHVCEWITYPQTPIHIGPNTREPLLRDISRAYDRQMVIHPACFGFTLRWHQDNDIITESMYMNPIFSGYELNKSGLDIQQREELRIRMLLLKKSHPS